MTEEARVTIHEVNFLVSLTLYKCINCSIRFYSMITNTGKWSLVDEAQHFLSSIVVSWHDPDRDRSAAAPGT
jgi:hypothetical protein